MGCSFSCRRLLFTSEPSNGKTIRVVHLNGYVEHLEHPVTVAQVTGEPPKHLLFTHAQLLCNASTPLKLDTLLETGRVYFLLPHTLFHSNVSPTDLAPLARKLAALAQNSSSKSKSRKQSKTSGVGGNSPFWSSPAASPNRGSVGAQMEKGQVFVAMQKSSKSRLWKPILATIREISFNRRSESDLQDDVKVD